MTQNILTKINDEKRAHVAACKARVSFAALEEKIKNAPPLRGFKDTLAKKIASGQTALITEIKKASPSAGVIVPNYNPAAIAKKYEDAGASCLSVLTDTPAFQGRDDDLITARAACALPVLRKDFMLDVYQIAESRALGADCVLLIMASLSDAQARELMDAATRYALSVLVEVHDRAELDRALPLVTHNANAMLGINNRNLKTLVTDLATTETLVPFAPSGTLLVGESGIRNPADIARLKAANVSCFLVGEHLLKSADIGAATRAMLS